jgi:hypothetical protein
MDNTHSLADVFRIPKDGPTYIEQVRNRCHDLIQCGIWTGLHVQKLNQWWSNFKTDTEQYFAACLLDNVIYRSTDQTLALMRQLIQRVLPDHGRVTNGIINWQERLNATLYDPGVRIIPVIPPKSPQGKSAYVILRHFEKRLGINKKILARPEEIPTLLAQGIETIVFIDDLLGTGTQFVTEFAIHYALGLPKYHTKLIYAPLVAHDEGINNIQTSFPHISIASAEILGRTHALFGAQGRAFNDGINTPQSAWNFYADILKTRNINLDSSSLRGFGELELAFFFEHAAPDNCLPIFWWNSSPNWKPLFYR